MKPAHIRAAIIGLVLIAMATRSWAAPCGTSPMPCDLAAGAVSPYTGVLMSEATADDLIADHFEAKRLAIKLAGADEKIGILNVRVAELEAAPAFYETPWFWLGLIGAGALGVWAGSELAR